LKTIEWDTTHHINGCTNVLCSHLHLTLQHAATRGNTLQHTATHCSAYIHTHAVHVRQHTATHCNVLQCVAVCSLQCVAVCWSVLFIFCDTYVLSHTSSALVVTYCTTLQHIAAHCNTLQCVAVCSWQCCSVLQRFVYVSQYICISAYMQCTCGNSLLHTATHCNVLQCVAASCICFAIHMYICIHPVHLW